MLDFHRTLRFRVPPAAAAAKFNEPALRSAAVIVESTAYRLLFCSHLVLVS
jgi:hypothetical protein